MPGNPQPVTIIDQEDGGVGLWFEFGFTYLVGQSLNLGIDVRYSKADATVSPENFHGTVTLDSGGLHGLLFVGYHW